MKRLFLPLICAFTLSAPATAAPVPKGLGSDAGPTIVAQTASIDDAVGRLQTFVGSIAPPGALGGPPDFKAQLGALPGIDTKRGFGAYATLKENLFNTELVVLVPVTGEEAFVKFLKEMDIEVRDTDDGHVLEVPDVPLPIYLHFAQDYAYLSLSTPDPISPKNRLSPKSVISTDDKSIIALTVRVDRVPEGLKELAISSMDGMMAMMQDQSNTVMTRLMTSYLTLVKKFYTRLLTEGKELYYSYDLDPKTGELIGATRMTARDGTQLQKDFANFGPVTNDFASLVRKDSAARVMLSSPLFDSEMRDLFTTITRAVAEETRGIGILPEARDFVTVIEKGVIRSIESGKLEVAAAMHGPNKDDQYTIVGAVTFKDTAELAESWRKLAKTAPENVQQSFHWDVAKVGEVSIHEAKLGKTMPAQERQTLEKIFGETSIYYAFAPDAVYVTFGAGALDALKEAMKAKPQKAPVFQTQVALKQMVPFIKAAGGEMGPLEQQIIEKRDVVTLLEVTAEGGDALTMKARTGLMMWGMIGYTAAAQFEGVAEQVAPPPPGPPAAVPPMEEKPKPKN